ncbi:PPOX class F420-dependent oxidoreductase [Symbioplanes lichenis]|uniref:PPOX class F420-dependent oxidoreductase n=1 Tax=Symbioplanes lichenis TaxID=1629072 RepID=UPI0027390E45|nr:PPOX class F420-dependent oxidoreductase [Actinoplanes lichenis]
MATLEQLGAEKYVLVTTYRKDGRAVPTPVWVVPDGSGLAFWTFNSAAKLKRIRNNGRVTLTACDMRGNPRGDALEASARVGDGADLRRIKGALRRKYGLAGWLTLTGSRLRRGADGTSAVLVS